MKFKNLKTGRVYDLRDGVVVNGFCNHKACHDCPIWDKDTGESCVGKIYQAPYDIAQKMGYEVLEQDYVTWIRVCDNQVDVAGERLSTSGLYGLATLLTGKRFLIDDGLVKIVTAEVRGQGEIKTLYALVAIEPTPETERLREALESNSPPGFLVSYLAKSEICSICENPTFKGRENDKCHHIVGQEYDGKKCVRILDGVSELMDWGFEGWLASEYRDGMVKKIGMEEKEDMEDKTELLPENKAEDTLSTEDSAEDIERFKAELKQKSLRDWTLGELQKFCQNTQMCSQECPFTNLCDQVWVDSKVPGEWRLGSQFKEQDRNDAHKVMEIFGCDGRLKRRGKALLFNGTIINYWLFPGLADGEEVWLKEILEDRDAD